MKEIFLNTWHSSCKKPLENFIRTNSAGTNIFCLQEILESRDNFYKKALPNFEALMVQKEDNMGIAYKLGIFVKKPMLVEDSGIILNDDTMGIASWVKIKLNDTGIVIVNVHGTPQPGDKMDTDIRVKQSKIIIDFLDTVKEPKIIGGDFNLLPDTKSLKMFEEAGYRNLIKDFGIKNTRNRLAWEQSKNNPGFVKQYFADYVFVSPEIKVKNFEVPNIEVSDHLPMILDFEV